MTSRKDFSTPRLFILQFISNKTKVLTVFLDESYHNTSIYHINKKKNIKVRYS